MIKILSYVIKEEMVYVVTDNKDRPNFAYKIDKFKNKGDLKKEINKSLTFEKKRKEKKTKKIKHLTDELEEK